jgi:hypothetical protein
MVDPNLVALATGAGGNVVASMITGSALVIRARLTQYFRAGTPDELASALAAYDNDARAFEEWVRATRSNPELASELASTKAQLSQEWTRRLVEFIITHPAAKADLEALATVTDPPKYGNQLNAGSGTFVNGTVFGGIHNSYGESS